MSSNAEDPQSRIKKTVGMMVGNLKGITRLTLDGPMLKPYLCYYELHVDGRTFFVHMVVPAETIDEAVQKMPEGHFGPNYQIQKKGCFGVMEGSGLAACMKMLHHIGGDVPSPGENEEHFGHRFFVFPTPADALCFISSAKADVLITSHNCIGNAVSVSPAAPGLDRLTQRVAKFGGRVVF